MYLSGCIKFDIVVHSTFIMSPRLNLIETTLKEKIGAKLETVMHPKVTVLTLLHGSFVGRHIFLKRNPNKGTYDRKLLDYQGITLGPPVIDFGRVLIAHLPCTFDLSTIYHYCKEMLDIYMMELKNEYPQVNSTLVRQEIINYMLYAYINTQESDRISNHGALLRAFDRLGCFD